MFMSCAIKTRSPDIKSANPEEDANASSVNWQSEQIQKSTEAVADPKASSLTH